MNLAYEEQTPLVRKVTLGLAQSGYEYNSFGELASQKNTGITQQSGLVAELSHDTVTETPLVLSGSLPSEATLTVNSQEFSAGADGVLDAEIDLSSGENELNLTLKDADGSQVDETSRVVTLDEQNQGDVKNLKGFGQKLYFETPESSGGLSQIVWREMSTEGGAEQPLKGTSGYGQPKALTQDSAGNRFYLYGDGGGEVKLQSLATVVGGQKIFKYAGGSLEEYIALPEGFPSVSEMVVGADDRIYLRTSGSFSSGSAIYRIVDGQVELFKELSYSYEIAPSTQFAANDEGILVGNRWASDGQTIHLYEPNGDTSIYHQADFDQFASSRGGQLCYTLREGNQVDCRAPDGSMTTHNPGFNPTSVAVGGGGGVYVANEDQIYSLAGSDAVGLRDLDYEEVQGELTVEGTIGSATKLAVDYNHDELGRITKREVDILGQSRAYEYEYDEAGRLVEVRRNGSVHASYAYDAYDAYDANGNRVEATVNGETVTADYDAQDRLIRYEDAQYSYTANGELRTKTEGGETTSYDYDHQGNLHEVELPNGDNIDYLVDGKNRRIGKKINGELVQGFLYKDQLNPVAELDGDGNVVSRFIYAHKANVPAYMEKNGKTYRLISDHLGSVRLVMNAQSGEIVQRIDYDTFGNITKDSNPGFQPFGFAGGLHDRDTGLVRFGARDYDPATGRWTAKDPILFQGGQGNLYGYLLNDPMNMIDPNGKQAEMFGGVVTDPSYAKAQQIEAKIEKARDEATKKPDCVMRCVGNFAAGTAMSEAASRTADKGGDLLMKKAAGTAANVCGAQVKRLVPVYNLFSTGESIGNTAGCIKMCVSRP